MKQWTGSKLGKECIKTVYCHAAYLTSIQSTSYKMLGRWCTSWKQDCWQKYQQLQICRWRHFDDTKRRRTKEPLDESEKAGIKLNIQKMKMMASGPITSWQIDGETMKTMTDFILLDSQVIADGDCSHEIKRCLLLGRKAMTNLASI